MLYLLYFYFSSFDKYKAELDSGKLRWGFLHSSDFWEDNFKNFEFQNFEYIRILSQILKAPIIKDSDVEMKCIACFDIGEFAKLYPAASGVLAEFGTKDILLELISHSNIEIKNRALVCLQKIMMKSHVKK